MLKNSGYAKLTYSVRDVNTGKFVLDSFLKYGTENVKYNIKTNLTEKRREIFHVHIELYQYGC